MSNWVAPPPPPERPSRNGCLVVGCIVAAIGMFALAASFVFAVSWLYGVIQEVRQARIGPPPPLVEMSDEEYQTQVASGFRQQKDGVDAGTLKSIERFFREASRLRDKEASAPEVMRLIDGRRALAQIQRSANCVKLLPADRTSLREAPCSYNPFTHVGWPVRIVHAALQENGQEVVVWGYFPDANGDLQPMRWWLARAREGWRVFNWEDCDTGRSEAEEIAIMMSLTYRREEAWKFFNTLANEADAVTEKPYLVADGRRRLDALDVTALDERLFDDGVMRVAFARYHLRDYERCLELCDLVKRPNIRPDVERTRTFCLQQLQKWEEAAQAAERYERLIGSTPVVLAAQARALVHLSRNGEAERAWRRVLSVSPTDTGALAGWAELLPDDRKHELVEHLRAVSDSRGPAQQLVEQLCAAEDEAGAHVVAEWLAKEAPDSRECLQAAADLKNFDEDFAAAAALYLAAYDKATSDEERSSLQYSYLQAMAAAGRQVEAHAQAPDKRAVLEAYWYDYTDDGAYELTRPKLLAIVAQHKRSDPEDPLLAQIEANLLSDAGRHAEAEKILLAALAKLKKQPGADREEMLKNELVNALLSQAKWKEAIAQRPQHYDLAAMAGRLLSWGRRTEARALMDYVERTTPAEPALHLCRAELLRAEKKYAEAWKALPPPIPSSSPNNPLAWRLNHLASDLVVDDETLLTGFAARAPDNATWNTLAIDLQSHERWDTLAKVVEIWRAAHPSQPELLYFDALVKSHAKDHAAVVALLAKPLTDAATVEQLNFRRQELHLLLVESLLALGRADEAGQHGQYVLQQDANIEPLLLVLLAAGDVAAIEQAAGSSGVLDRSSGSLPYHESRFAPLLTDERFLPLRRSHPPTLEYAYLDDRLTLLLPAQVPPSPEEVQQRIAGALPGASFRLLALPGSSPRIQTLEALRGDERWLITIGSEPYVSGESRETLVIDDAPLRKAVAAHRSWIEIGRDDRQAAAEPRSLAAIAAALEPPPASVVYLQSGGRLALWDESLAKRLAGPAGELKDVGQSAYLDPEDEELKPVGRRAWREFVRKYRQRDADPKPFRVQIELSLGGARERLWFAVTRLEPRQPWRSALVGTAESDSLLLQTLKAGEPRQIERYRVLAVDPAE